MASYNPYDNFRGRPPPPSFSLNRRSVTPSIHNAIDRREALCEYCTKVPLYLLSQGVTRLPEERWSLGSGRRIKASRCPLCKVVARLFHRFSQTGWTTDYMGTRVGTAALSEEPNVVLRYYWTGGPAGRPAFTIESLDMEFNIWICGIDDSTSTTPYNTPEIRYLKPSTTPEFDEARLKRWLAACAAAHAGMECLLPIQHSNATVPGAFPGLQTLRLLDVSRDSLVEVDLAVPSYAALSYVCGDATSIRLTTTNLPSLLQPGSLEYILPRLPYTIRDAIALVRRLGIRYLWVDALCLVQNDPDDVARGCEVMDRIYERSWLTIIAADGHNADAGLPGLREGTRPLIKLDKTPIVPGLSLGVFQPLDRLLKRSLYSTRAWTFQEQLFARRVIYFVNKQVYFRCRGHSFAERLTDQPPGQRDAVVERGASLMHTIAAMDNPLQSFETILKHYTERSLSQQADILRALAGTIRRVGEKARCRFFEGLPTCAFDAFLVFHPRAGVLRRRSGFPSYSWTGWKGSVGIDGLEYSIMWNLNRWLTDNTWIVWYKRSASHVVNPIWDPSANESFPVHDGSYAGYRKRRAFQPPKSLVSRQTIACSRTYPTEHLPYEIDGKGYPLLQFWTLSVHFTIAIKDVFRGTASIIGRDGQVVGETSMDGLEETTFFDTSGPLEFIVLSVPETTGHGEYAGRDIYFVMLLEWDGQVAERKGLGVVEQWAVGNGFGLAIWKEVLLG
jgi:hypothetical protein